jgi:hypothetical protein
MAFVQDEYDSAAALGLFGLQCLLGLGDQRCGVKPGGVAERADDLGVDPARADHRVGEVDQRVPARVQPGRRRAGGDGLASTDLTADHAERSFLHDPADPRDRLLV